MEKSKTPVAIDAAEAPVRVKRSNYLKLYASAREAATWRSFRSHPPRRVPLEVGDRTPGGVGAYPDDIEASLGADGKWRFAHKNGDPY